VTLTPRFTVVLAVAAFLAIAGTRSSSAQTAQATSPATAKSPDVKESHWLLEAHGALAKPIDALDGTGSLPTTGALVQGRVSASTFMFGDGAALFNQAQSGSPIVPLDSVLTNSTIARTGGPLFGARIVRSLGARLAIEGTADYQFGETSWRASTLTALETTRASYPTAIKNMLSSSIATDATATSSLVDHQRVKAFTATGGLRVKLKTSGGTIPYVVGGAGWAIFDQSEPTATVAGSYQLGSPAQLFATDTVTLRYSDVDHSLVFFGGGGLQQAVSRSTGFTLDARFQVRDAGGVSVVDASPSRAANSVGPSLPAVTRGALHFDATGPLNGAPIIGAPTFTETGRRTQMIFAAGWFFRF